MTQYAVLLEKGDTLVDAGKIEAHSPEEAAKRTAQAAFEKDGATGGVYLVIVEKHVTRCTTEAAPSVAIKVQSDRTPVKRPGKTEEAKNEASPPREPVPA